MFVWQENSLQRRSARVEFFVFCSFYNWHIVVAIVLCDKAYGWPVIFMVVWIVGDKLLCVCLVQSVNLNSALQGVAQQEHLHLHKKGKKIREIIALLLQPTAPSAAGAHDIYGWGFFMDDVPVKASINTGKITIKISLSPPQPLG